MATTSRIAMGGFVEEVKERSKGELIIDWIGGPEAIPMFGQHEAAISGAVDIVFTVGTFYKDRVPENASIVLSEISPMEMRETGYYDEIKEAHRKANLYYLGLPSYISGYYVWLVDPIESPTELAGLRFPSNIARDPMFKALGIVGVDIDDPEVYTGLERGVIDGHVDPIQPVWEMGFYEVSNYFIDHPWFSGGVTLVMNLDSWNQLPEHLQKVLTDSVIVVEAAVLTQLPAIYEEFYQNIVNAGVKPIKFSTGDAKWYVDTVFSAAWKDVEQLLGPERTARLRDMISK